MDKGVMGCGYGKEECVFYQNNLTRTSGKVGMLLHDDCCFESWLFFYMNCMS